MPPLPTTPTLWADMSVGVGANDLADVTVPLRSGLRVAGRIEFTGSTTPPANDQWSSIGITLEPADSRTSSMMSSTRGRVETTGQFQTLGVAPGKYVLRVNAPRGWIVRDAKYNGQDIVDMAVDLRDGDANGVVVTFADRPGSLAGTVTMPNGSPDATASVIVFPADRGMWTNTGPSPRRLKNVRTGKDGSYNAGQLVPGDYLVAAVPDSAAADWQNADFLQAVSGAAAHVHIDEGENKTQALQTARVR
jgi:hypothetical protein